MTALRMNLREQRSAYTIIEILLVIVVIAVMAVAGAQFAANQAREAKIKVAKHEMNQITTAGLAYYQANELWPTQAQLDTLYLPQLKSKKNPWGNDYVTGRDAEDKGSFSVKTLVPEKEIADRLAAVLPSAKSSASGSNFEVIAYAGSIPTPPDLQIVVGEIGMSLSSEGGRTDATPATGEVAATPRPLKLGDWPVYDDAGNQGERDKIYEENDYVDGNISQAQFQGEALKIPKPTCDLTKYTQEYRVMQAGFSKNCAVFEKTLLQCDKNCSTEDIYCTDTGNSSGITHFTYTYLLGHTTYKRGGTDVCCNKDGLSYLVRNTCRLAEHAPDMWRCDTFSPVPYYVYLIPFFPLSALVIDSATLTEATFFDDVTIKEISDTPTDWLVRVHTDGIEPSGAAVGGTKRANDSYIGKVSYITYCKPIP